MEQLSLDQRKALALASARLRLADQSEDAFGGQEASMVSRAKNAVGEFFRPSDAEDIPEAPYLFQAGDEQSLDLYREGVDPTAQATTDARGRTVWGGEQGRVYPDHPNVNLRDVPQFFSDATDFSMDAAPLVAGGGQVAAMKYAPAMAKMAGIGGANALVRESAEEVAGGDGDFRQVPIEAVLSGAGEFGARALTRVFGPVFSRMFGDKADAPLVANNGQFTDEGLKLLEQAQQAGGFDDALSQELSTLTRQGALTADEAQRFNVFAKHSIEPTRANITRTADDWQLQQEALKRSGKVRSAVEQQDGQIRQAFDDMRPATDATAADAALGLRETVEEADQAVSAAYRAAREAAPDEKIVCTGDFYSAVRELLPDDARTRGVINSVWGRLEQNGIAPGNRISPKQAEELRIFLNGLYDSANPAGNAALRTMKDSLDESVARVSPDSFADARALKAGLESSLDRASVSRRDMRSGRGLVRDIVENRVDPDQLTSVLKRSSTRAADIADLQSAVSRKQWDGVRGSVFDDLTESVFRGPEGELGFQAGTRHRLEQWIKQWGGQKLAKILTQDERAFLKDMQMLFRYREPIAMTQQGKGPSAQGMAAAADRVIRRLPVVGDLSVDLLKVLTGAIGDERLAAKALQHMSQGTAQALTNAQRDALVSGLVRQAGGVRALPAAAVIEAQDSP